MIKVYIVTNVEFGWDCIVGVFSTDHVTYEELETRYPNEQGYVLFERTVENEIEED